MLRKLAKGFQVFTAAFTVLAFVLMAFFTVPRLFGYKPFIVRSGSMEPEIGTGSVVFVDTNDRDVEVGDVVTFSLATGETSGVQVTHRVSCVDASGLIETRGDKNDHADGYLDPEAVVGTVVFHVEYAGYLLDLLQRRKGFLWMAGMVCLLYLVSGTLGLVTGTMESA